jgi:hypothetical protein
MSVDEPFDFKETLAGLERQRRILVDQRTSLENELSEVKNQIEHLTGAIRHISPLSGSLPAFRVDDLSELGITDAIRAVLRDSTEPLNAGDIAKTLMERGFDMSRYTSGMASIYKILRRLMDDSKEIERISEDGDGKAPYQYRWIRTISDDDIPF